MPLRRQRPQESNVKRKTMTDELARLETERREAVKKMSEAKDEKAMQGSRGKSEEVKKAREELTKLKMEAANEAGKLERESRTSGSLQGGSEAGRGG